MLRHPVQTSGRSDKKWIFGEFSNVDHKNVFSPIERRCSGRTGSDINMRISLLETRNRAGCTEGGHMVTSISTSGQQGHKVQNAKIAFCQNRACSIARYG